MKKFLIFILMGFIINSISFNFCAAKIEEPNSKFTQNTQDSKILDDNDKNTEEKNERIKEVLKSLDLKTLKGEEVRNKIYDLLKSDKEILEIFEPATKNAERLSDILGEYDLRNYTNDFYIVLNNILKEKTQRSQDI